LERGGSSVVGCGRSGTDRPQPTTLLPPRFNSKPEATTAVYKLLMMGKRMPETCWAVFEWRAINLGDWFIWLVDLFEFETSPHFTVCCERGDWGEEQSEACIKSDLVSRPSECTLRVCKLCPGAKAVNAPKGVVFETGICLLTDSWMTTVVVCKSSAL